MLIEEVADLSDQSTVKRNYKVWDQTKKVYDVLISNLPACNCPASSKGLNCVHILFIFIKVYQVPRNEPILYQRALLTSELMQIYSNPPSDYNVSSQVW